MSTAKPRAWLAWSSGKDAAWTLHEVRDRGEFEVTGLLTTVTGSYSRVSMHGVREELLALQAESAGLPLHRAVIPVECSNEIYEDVMAGLMQEARTQGVTHVIFGDLFLEDIRAYRRAQLARVGLEGVFPLWGRDTTSLAREMVEGGLKAYVACLDPRTMPRELAGHLYDDDFLEALPSGVDPCGENGEFHTFASAGPMFEWPIPVEAGRTVERDGFVFTDLLRREERA